MDGTRFLINGQLTSPGKPAEGQLLNTRMAQAIFDDENPATVGDWAYPDTHLWDPQRNTNELLAMLPVYAQHGIRMITVGLQGGCTADPQPALTCPGGDHPWIVSAFNPAGSLKPAWMTRLGQVIRAADANGIVVMVQFFYHGQESKVLDQFAAVNNITDWLANGGYRNVLVETANECNAGFSTYLDCSNEANVVKQVQDRSGGKLTVSVSFTGGGMPSDDVISQEDLVLLHGNGQTTQQVVDLINGLKAKAAYQDNPKPIVVNEDSTSLDNMNASVAAGGSWGYLDTGGNNYVDGYQSPPVNWTINTAAKQAFFDNTLRLAGPNSVATATIYTGSTTADYHDPAALSARLQDLQGTPIPDMPLNFAFGGPSRPRPTRHVHVRQRGHGAALRGRHGRGWERRLLDRGAEPAARPRHAQRRFRGRHLLPARLGDRRHLDLRVPAVGRLRHRRPSGPRHHRHLLEQPLGQPQLARRW